jgi:U3 small nucleolar RNA-associated protein 6
MTNVDGLYAMDDVAEDTVIFREDDMPDCKLHRTSEVDKANCKLVELDDGLQAIVSCKFIRAGEFFCIPDSSDEEGDSDDDEGGGWFVDAGDNDDDDFVCRRC